MGPAILNIAASLMHGWLSLKQAIWERMIKRMHNNDT